MNGRKGITFAFWLLVSVIIYGYGLNEYVNGDMVRWYYYRAKADGYAINDDSFLKATRERPVALAIVRSEEINGSMAVPVRQGDLLPDGANGVIPSTDVTDGKRVAIEGDKLTIMIPTQIKEQNGIKYVDSYRHKNVETNPWSGVWNVLMVVSLGFALGMLAQAFTDLLGITFRKIDHFQRPGASL